MNKPPPYPVDASRTFLRAHLVENPSEAVSLHGGQQYAKPGIVQEVYCEDGTLHGFNVACPGCGHLWFLMTSERGACEEYRWNLKGWRRGDVELLCIVPLMHLTCCGWHGILLHGMFEAIEIAESA